jgi:hypothetical protein
MKEPIRSCKALLTEKDRLKEGNHYLFRVAKRANKIEIKQAIETFTPRRWQCEPGAGRRSGWGNSREAAD